MHGRLAQLVEHSLDVRRVSSSSLLTSTTVKEIGFCQSLFYFPGKGKPPVFAGGFCFMVQFKSIILALTPSMALKASTIRSMVSRSPQA